MAAAVAFPKILGVNEYDSMNIEFEQPGLHFWNVSKKNLLQIPFTNTTSSSWDRQQILDDKGKKLLGFIQQMGGPQKPEVGFKISPEVAMVLYSLMKKIKTKFEEKQGRPITLIPPFQTDQNIEMDAIVPKAGAWNVYMLKSRFGIHGSVSNQNNVVTTYDEFHALAQNGGTHGRYIVRPLIAISGIDGVYVLEFRIVKLNLYPRGQVDFIPKTSPEVESASSSTAQEFDDTTVTDESDFYTELSERE